MTESTEKLCPRCQKVRTLTWSVCPYCGFRLKPADDLLKRTLIWIAILSGYIALVISVARKDRDLAIYIGIGIGLPLAYTFGKAVIFRLSGEPLTLGQLGRTTIRSLVVVIVLPIIVGASVLILAFLVCIAGGTFF